MSYNARHQLVGSRDCWKQSESRGYQPVKEADCMPIVPNDPLAVQRTETVRVECPVCGKSFLLFPSQQSRYCCSWKCRRIYAQSPERQQARFLSHVDVADEACWLWMAYCDDDGYGVTSDTSGEGKGRTIDRKSVV